MGVDETWMNRALELARGAGAAGEVPVGAVLVSATGQELACGANAPIAQCDPTAHAEIVALRHGSNAVGNYRLPPGTTIYVTLEPCAMCAAAISFARVSRVVFAAEDPKGGAIAHGPRFFEQTTCHWRPDVTAGVAAEDAAALLRSFFAARRAK